jgi:hypothetical protein
MRPNYSLVPVAQISEERKEALLFVNKKKQKNLIMLGHRRGGDDARDPA